MGSFKICIVLLALTSSLCLGKLSGRCLKYFNLFQMKAVPDYEDYISFMHKPFEVTVGSGDSTVTSSFAKRIMLFDQAEADHWFRSVNSTIVYQYMAGTVCKLTIKGEDGEENVQYLGDETRPPCSRRSINCVFSVRVPATYWTKRESLVDGACTIISADVFNLVGNSHVERQRID